MLDLKMTEDRDAPTTLDRAWAATRPDDLSPEAFDRIWAGVQHAYDVQARPSGSVLPFRPRGLTIALVALGLAQAAAVLVLAFAPGFRPEPARQPGAIALNDPASTTKARVGVTSARLEELDVSDGEMILVTVADNGTTSSRRIDSDISAVLAFNLQVSASNPGDALGHLEGLAP